MIDLDEGEQLEKTTRPRTTFELDCFGGYNNWEYVASDEQSALVDWLWANAQALIAAARELDRLRGIIGNLQSYGDDRLDCGVGSYELLEEIVAALKPSPQPEAATDAPPPASARPRRDSE